MDKLLEYILQKTNNQYDNIKLVGVVYDKPSNTSTFRFVYKDRNLYVDDKTRITELVKEFYNNSFNVDVKLKKSYLDEDVIREFVYRIIMDELSSVSKIDKYKDVVVKINGEEVSVEIFVCKQYFEYVVHKKIEERLIKDCNANFFGNFQVVVKEKDYDADLDAALKENAKTVELQIENLVDSFTPKTVQVTNIEKIAGNQEALGETCMQISTLKGAMPKVQICGKVAFLLERKFTSKKPDADGNFPEKTYYSFNLNDGSGHINCVYFPLKAEKDQEFPLKDGYKVLAVGDLEDFNGRVNFKVKGISTCDFEEVKEQAQEITEFKDVNPEYYYVKPEPYFTESQANFLVVEKEPNEFLKQNEIVVFDVETTGFDSIENEIIEIGAIKLRNGQMCETFSTFVKPAKPIPREITELTTITDDMVKNAPNIKQVMPDFYKFCHNCVLVAYNIDFDYKFINAASTKCGYKFRNRQVDALYLARINVAGAKNFQLKNIANRLGVVLDGAHRAINDAIATAEVLKLISDNVPATE